MAIPISEFQRPSEEQRSSSRRYSRSFLREIPERARRLSRWPNRCSSFSGASSDDFLADDNDTQVCSSRLSTHLAFYSCIAAKQANFEDTLTSIIQGSEHLSVKPPMGHSEPEQACAPLPTSARIENQSNSSGGVSSNDSFVDVTQQLKHQVLDNGQTLQRSSKRSTHHALFARMAAKETDSGKNQVSLAPGSAYTDRPGSMKPPPGDSEPARACAPLPISARFENHGKVSTVSDDADAMMSSSSHEPKQAQAWHKPLKLLRTLRQRRSLSSSVVSPM